MPLVVLPVPGGTLPIVLPFCEFPFGLPPGPMFGKFGRPSSCVVVLGRASSRELPAVLVLVLDCLLLLPFLLLPVFPFAALLLPALLALAGLLSGAPVPVAPVLALPLPV
jgi:hypothetical protein